MIVAVLGQWHLGSVTAACIAAAGHDVTGWDPDPAVISRLKAGEPPVAEPGLPELMARVMGSGRLQFDPDLGSATRRADVIWIAFDTPVDDDDRADVEFVVRHSLDALSHARADAVVLCSSQWPVGTVRTLEARGRVLRPDARWSFACSPENLRLGKAIEVFTNPDRVIVGTRDDRARAVIAALFEPITTNLEFMSVESAEMTKHAINGFLAASVTFINEIAALCERTGADARDVARGLKTERRIGPHAYLSPGAAFAGGTLARDVWFLRDLGRAEGRATPLFDGIAAANELHRAWLFDRLRAEFADLRGRRIAIWGLTYKPGTDTLRRSSAVALIRKLREDGADVHVHDPAARELSGLSGVLRHDRPIDAALGADALVVATEWPEYRDVDVHSLFEALAIPVVIDPNRFLRAVGDDGRFRVLSVGQPS